MNPSPITLGVCLSGENTLDIDAFAAACCVELAFVRLLVDEGMLVPVVEQPLWRFGGEELAQVRRILRLQRDFDASLSSVAVMLDLLQQVHRLRAQLRCAGVVAL